jgi:hypothetical protein
MNILGPAPELGALNAEGRTPAKESAPESAINNSNNELLIPYIGARVKREDVANYLASVETAITLGQCAIQTPEQAILAHQYISNCTLIALALGEYLTRNKASMERGDFDLWFQVNIRASAFAQRSAI